MRIQSSFIIVWTSCTLMFLIQFIIVLIDYNAGKTGIGRSQVASKAPKLLPCLTFCPMPAFKSSNFTPLSLETNMESFRNLTYRREEIFPNNTLKEEHKWTMKEMRILMFGKCFVTCNGKPRQAMEFFSDGLAYRLNSSLNYQVTVHAPGDEFWLLASFYPYTVTSFLLKSNSVNQFKSADLHLEEIEIVSAQKGSKPCDPNISQLDLVKCVNKSLENELQTNPKYKCKLTLSEYDAAKPDTKLCTDEESTMEVSGLVASFLQKIGSDPGSVGCRVPCTTKLFKTNINYFPRTGTINQPLENSFFELYPYYDKISTTVETEYFIQDLSTLLTSVGGNLGLFLGYSVMSLILGTAEVVQLWWQKRSARK